MTFKWLYFTQVMLNLDSEILIQSLNWIFLMFGLGGGVERERGLVFPSVWPVLSVYGRPSSCDLGWLWFPFHT